MPRRTPPARRCARGDEIAAAARLHDSHRFGVAM
jgi:hypothetical protein